MNGSESGGRTRRVAIDWDELETAMTWHSDEWTSYLDVRLADHGLETTNAPPER